VNRWYRALATTALALVFLSTPAWARKHHPKPSGPQVHPAPAVFLGAIFLSGDSSNFSGSLTASSCTLTVPTNTIAISEGVGPNGSLLLDGSNGCSGMFELFLSNGGADDVGAVPTTGGIGSNTGVYGGTFAIVSTTDPTVQGQTVVWAGAYTQVFNIDPTGMGCGSLNFCANLGPAFGTETFNGFGLSYLLELNGFTWSVTGT
jgi:hypothetical protein